MTTTDPFTDAEVLAARAGHVLFTEGPEQPAATAREVCALLDSLVAAEARAIRAEAQSEARRVNAVYWKGVARGNAIAADVWKESAEEAQARVKAVEDVLDQSRDDTTLHTYPEQLNADIRRALGNDHPPSA